MQYKKCNTVFLLTVTLVVYLYLYLQLAVITRPPDGVLLALAARRLAWLLELLVPVVQTEFRKRSPGSPTPSSGRSLSSVRQVSLSRSVPGVS